MGSKQGQTELCCMKERSSTDTDMSNEGEEEEESGDDIFFKIKQIDVHVMEGVHGGIIV